MTQYEYRALPVLEVLGMIRAVPPIGSWAQLLDDGFRWVRTERDQAIFERVKPEPENRKEP